MVRQNTPTRMDMQQSKSPWWQPPLLFFAKLNSWIIGPVLLALIAGRWLDKKLGTNPWFFVVFLGAAFVLSMMKMVMIARGELKKYRDLNKK